MSRVVSNMADSQMKQRQTTKILAEIKGQEIANAQADFSNYLLQKYGENEKVSHLNDLIASAALTRLRSLRADSRSVRKSFSV